MTVVPTAIVLLDHITSTAYVEEVLESLAKVSILKVTDANFHTVVSDLNTYYDRHNIDLIDEAPFADTHLETNALHEKANFNVLLVAPPDLHGYLAALSSGGSVTCDTNVDEV